MNRPRHRPDEISIIVELIISPEELLKLYRGVAKEAVATARDGRVVRFPAIRLQPFVTREGISGSFRLVINGQHKLLRVERCA